MGFPCKNGISRQEYWSGLQFPPPGDRSASPALSGGLFPAEPPGMPPLKEYAHIYARTLRLEEIQYLWHLKWHQNLFSNGTFSSLANDMQILSGCGRCLQTAERRPCQYPEHKGGLQPSFTPVSMSFPSMRSQRFLCWQGDNVHLPVQGSLLRALFRTCDAAEEGSGCWGSHLPPRDHASSWASAWGLASCCSLKPPLPTRRGGEWACSSFSPPPRKPARAPRPLSSFTLPSPGLLGHRARSQVSWEAVDFLQLWIPPRFYLAWFLESDGHLEAWGIKPVSMGRAFCFLQTG